MSLFDASEYGAPIEAEPLALFDVDPAPDDADAAPAAEWPADEWPADEGPAVAVDGTTGPDGRAGADLHDADVARVSRSRREPPAPDPERLWRPVIGQDHAIAQLRAWVKAPVHAYLFIGPPGCGKRTAATAFAASLLCPNGGCGTCDVCVRTVARIHPDLAVVEREGAFISVDQAREIIRLASRSPIEGNRQVLVLVDFHLVLNAGPTLLKVIEEPPPSTIFVILAEQLPPELVTIASRCVQVPFAALSASVIAAALVDEGIEPERAERAAEAAGGRLDRARLLARDEFVGQRMSFWAELPRRLDGTGAAAASLAAQALALVDGAGRDALESRQSEELAALEEQLEAMGAGRGTVGLKRDLAERHKREQKRLRDDELRTGLASLQTSFRRALVEGDRPIAAHAMAAVRAIADANEALIRNPSTSLLLQALFLRIGPPGKRR